MNPQPAAADQDEPPLQLVSDPVAGVYEANATERIDQLIEYLGTSSGRLLLVGADSHLINEAERRGFQVLSFSPGEFEAASIANFPGPFQGCILASALEKMHDPLSVLKSIRSVLKETGSLMVVSPTTDSNAAKRFGTSWWEFKRSNLFYFSVDTLQSLLIKAGFGDPLISPDRSLVSLNYLRRKLAGNPRTSWRYFWLRRATSFTPVLRNKAFRLSYGKTRILVRPKTYNSTPLLSVIVPVYNEAATFVQLIEELLAKNVDGVDIEVVIVESNSTDGSRDLVRRYESHPRVRIIYEEKPRGKGYAVRTALKVVTGEVILIQDADLEYDINDYDALIAPLIQFRHNFVLGSRHSYGRNSWKIRKFTDSAGLTAYFNFGHVLFLTLFNVLYSQRLTDPFTMFKVFRRECLYGLNFETNRFDFDNELVIKLLRKGYRPLELPVNYESRSVRQGKKITLVRDPLTWIRAFIKFRNSPLYEKDQSK